MINKFGNIIYWKVLSGIFLLAIYYNIFRLSHRVTYKQSHYFQPAKEIKLKIDICYDLNLDKELCKDKADVSSHKKEELTCVDGKFSKPIGCLTEDLKSKSVKEIISKFKECNLEKQTNVKSETNSTIELLSENKHEYELFSGYICVKYKFDVKDEKEFSKIKIYPDESNKQSFHIIIQASRVYSNSAIHHSLKTHLLERYCWIKNEGNSDIDPKIDSANETENNQNNTQTTNKPDYHCSDDNKEILFEMFYFTQKNLEYPMDSECEHRKNSNQKNCYETCIKKYYEYYLLTYSEKDETILKFDKNIAKEHIKKCTNECKNPDCIEGTFQVPSLTETNSSSNNFILLQIHHLDKPTVAKKVMKGYEFLYLALMFTCLFFGIDLYWLIAKATNMYNNPIKKSKKSKLLNKKLISLFVMFIIGIVVSVVLEMELFNFGKNNEIVFTKLDSIKERNLSVSICFDLCNILKPNSLISKENCTNELLMELDLKTLKEITWNDADFKKVSSMRNSVRIVPIRQADYPIKEFFREFKRCFLLFYHGKNLYPPISLQRKSQLHLNSSKSLFDYFYIEDGETYPQINAPFNKTSFLHNIHITDYDQKECTYFNKKYNSTLKCDSKDDCIQNCVLENYIKNHTSIPYYVNMKLIDVNVSPTLKFEDNMDKFKEELKICEKKFKETECYSIKTSLRTKYVETFPHDISMTLTPKIFSKHRVKDENILIVMNRIISFLIILTGFSVKDVVKGFVSTYLFSLASLYNFQFINRIAYLIVFFLFLIHFSYLFYSLISSPLNQISYSYVLKEIELPKIRLCYELKADLNDNSFTKKLLDSQTLNISQVLQSITLLDQNQERLTMNIKEVLGNKSLVKVYDFYVDSFKCFNFVFSTKYNVLNTNILDANRLVTFVMKLDELYKKRMFIHLNSNSLDFEWYFPLSSAYYNVIYMIEDFSLQDDFWFLKNMYSYIRNFFRLEILKNTHELYYVYLRDSFTQEQYVTTTVIPLGNQSDKDATIKNLQFNSYIHFRSLAGNKNDYNFNVNNRKLSFMSDFTSEKTYLGKNRLAISLRSILVKFNMYSTNKYFLIEFYLHLFILTSFWFKIDFSTLPISLKKAFPIAKFFLICFLYCVVVFLLFLFETWFKLIRFLDFKYA